MTALAFALPLALYLALLAGYDRAVSGGSAEGVARRLGLPVLARIAFPRPGQPPARDADRRLQDEARGLALRIRQYVPGSGGVILLTALREGREVDDLVAQLSRFFGVRDEKVLIVDARIARTRTSGLTRLVDRPALVVGPVESVPTVRDSRSVPAEAAIPGLVQYLVFEGQDPARFIVPTRVPAVDYLPPGAPYAMTDVLATQPMHELLAGLRQKYTLILLVGPPVVGGVDAEILAAYAHGVVVVVNGAADNPDALDDVFRSLREANAPLLGSVVCA